MACRRGFTEIARFLIHEAGVSVRVADDFGRTPLHDALWNRDPKFELVHLLIEEDPDLLLVCDKRGSTPFAYARREHWQSWRQFLYDRWYMLQPREGTRTLMKEIYEAIIQRRESSASLASIAALRGYHNASIASLHHSASQASIHSGIANQQCNNNQSIHPVGSLSSLHSSSTATSVLSSSFHGSQISLHSSSSSNHFLCHGGSSGIHYPQHHSQQGDVSKRAAALSERTTQAFTLQRNNSRKDKLPNVNNIPHVQSNTSLSSQMMNHLVDRGVNSAGQGTTGHLCK